MWGMTRSWRQKEEIDLNMDGVPSLIEGEFNPVLFSLPFCFPPKIMQQEAQCSVKAHVPGNFQFPDAQVDEFLILIN